MLLNVFFCVFVFLGYTWNVYATTCPANSNYNPVYQVCTSTFSLCLPPNAGFGSNYCLQTAPPFLSNLNIFTQAAAATASPLLTSTFTYSPETLTLTDDLGLSLVLYYNNSAYITTFANQLYCSGANATLCMSIISLTTWTLTPSTTYVVYFPVVPANPIGYNATTGLVVPYTSNGWFYVNCTADTLIYNPDLGVCTSNAFPGATYVSQTLAVWSGVSYMTGCVAAGSLATGTFLPVLLSTYTPTMSQYTCAAYAFALGYSVSGVVNGTACYGGFSLPTTQTQYNTTQCTSVCPGYVAGHDVRVGLPNRCGGVNLATYVYFPSQTLQAACPLTSVYSPLLGVCTATFNLCVTLANKNTYCVGVGPSLSYNNPYVLYETFKYYPEVTTFHMSQTNVYSGSTTAFIYPLLSVVASLQYFSYNPVTLTLNDQFNNVLCSQMGYVYSSNYCATTAQGNYDGQFLVVPVISNGTNLVWGLASESFIASVVQTDPNGIQVLDFGAFPYYPVFIQCTAPGLYYNTTLGLCTTGVACPPASPSQLTAACANALWAGIGCVVPYFSTSLPYWRGLATMQAVYNDMYQYTQIQSHVTWCLVAPPTSTPTPTPTPTLALTTTAPATSTCAPVATTAPVLTTHASIQTVVQTVNCTSAFFNDTQAFSIMGVLAFIVLLDVLWQIYSCGACAHSGSSKLEETTEMIERNNDVSSSDSVDTDAVPDGANEPIGVTGLWNSLSTKT